MKVKKLKSLLAFFLIGLVILAPLGQAKAVVIDGSLKLVQPYSNYGTAALYDTFGSNQCTASGNCEIGETFNVGTVLDTNGNPTAYTTLNSVNFTLSRHGSPTVKIYATIYNLTQQNRFAPPSTVTAGGFSDQLDTSTLLDASGAGCGLVPNNAAKGHLFNFTGANAVRLTNNTWYGIGLRVVQGDAGAISATNCINVVDNPNNPLPNNNLFLRFGSGAGQFQPACNWQVSCGGNSTDLAFDLNGTPKIIAPPPCGVNDPLGVCQWLPLRLVFGVLGIILMITSALMLIADATGIGSAGENLQTVLSHADLYLVLFIFGLAFIVYFAFG